MDQMQNFGGRGGDLAMDMFNMAMGHFNDFTQQIDNPGMR